MSTRLEYRQTIPRSRPAATLPVALDTHAPSIQHRAVFNQPLDAMPTTRHDTKAWIVQTWASFAIAMSLAAIGLAWPPGEDLDRAFMVMGYLFCLSSALVLAKTLRDGHEARAAQSCDARLTA